MLLIGPWGQPATRASLGNRATASSTGCFLASVEVMPATELPTPPKRVVDYGCGSGVLAIASLLLGSEWALGVDTDPQALVATRNNADRNGIAAQRLEVSLPNTDRPLADLVVANILAGPLCELADTLCRHLSSGGELLLSGILSEQVPALQAAYRHHIALSVLNEREGWVALYGKHDGSLR